LDGRTFTQLSHSLMSLSPRHIKGYGSIQRNSEVWIDAVGGHICSSQTYLLLYCKGRIDIISGIFQSFQCFNEDKHSNPVINGLTIAAIAHLDQLAITGDGIADGYILGDLLLGHS